MLDKDIKQRINTARQILVGKVPDPKAQVEQITNALIYKFMDDMDRNNEELGGKAQFLTGELKEFAWGRLMSRELSGMQRWELYTRALLTFSKSEQIPELFRSIFKDAYLPYRDPETLNLFLKEIHEFSYDNSENLGNAYEYLLSILGSQGDAGQFRTPRHIIDFIVECVGPQKTDRILDPACGTAGFLISSYKHIWRENSTNYDPATYTPSFAETRNTDSFTVEIQQDGKFNGAKLTPTDRTKLAKNIEGYDISPDMVRLSLVNMYLHNFPEPKIVEYDTLTYEDRWDDDFDVILANPPFMTPKGGIRPHRRFSVSANRAEVLFVDYIAEHLTVNGKAGIVVPEGIIFQTATAYKALRKMLVEDNYLYAVVSMPAGIFQPYAGVKTSVLLLDKELAKRNKEVLFVKVENDGFDLGAQRRRIDKNDLPKAYEIIGKWKKGEKQTSPIAQWVEKSKLAENGEYNLTGDRYRAAIDYSRVKWPMVELNEICDFKNGLWKGKKPPYEIVNIIRNTNFGKNGELKLDDIAELPVEIKQLETRKLSYGDIILENSGGGPTQPVGRVVFFDVNDSKIYSWSNFTSRIRVIDKNVSPKYLYHVLNHLYQTGYTENFQNRTSGIRNLDKKAYQETKIPLPPLDVQKALVAELDGYQKIIDGARQVVDNWKPQISIDPEWPKVKLGDSNFIKIIDGDRGVNYPKKSDFMENGYCLFLNTSNVRKGYFDFSKTDFISKEKDEKLRKGKLNKYDVVLTTRGTLGNTAFYGDNVNHFHLRINSGMVILRCNTDRLLPNFLLKMLNTNTFLNQMNNFLSGSAQPQLPIRILVEIQIPIPPLETQNKIVAEIETEQQAVDHNKKLIALYEQKIKDKVKEVWGE